MLAVTNCKVYWWEPKMEFNSMLFVFSSFRRRFVASPRVRSWAPSVPAVALCSGRCLWSPLEEWLKPPPSTNCSPMAGWPNLPAVCPVWRTSPTRPLVCLELPKHDGHVECPRVHSPFVLETLVQDVCRSGRIAALEDRRGQLCRRV